MMIKICHLWSDALNWNGSQGNLTCLKKRLEWRAIPVEIQEAPVGSYIDYNDYDLIYIGAGKPYENQKLLRDITAKAPGLKAYIDNGGTILAVCEGFELLGNTIQLADETECHGLGLVNMKTVYGSNRLTGNAIMETAYGNVVFFENHAGMVYPSDELPPLGRMVKGYGNNGTDGLCGIHTNTIFGCHTHGPLLTKNPMLADEILRTALFRNHPDQILPPLDDALEREAHSVMESKIL